MACRESTGIGSKYGKPLFFILAVLPLGIISMLILFLFAAVTTIFSNFTGLIEKSNAWSGLPSALVIAVADLFVIYFTAQFIKHNREQTKDIIREFAIAYIYSMGSTVIAYIVLLPAIVFISDLRLLEKIIYGK